MEESLSFTKAIFEGLNLNETNPRQLSPLVLAYIGDCAYDLIIKTKIVSEGNTQVNKMNKQASSLVKAEAQSIMIGVLEPLLTSDEEAIYKRGRNAKSYTSAKNASITDYRRATGFEALVGYLYLTEQFDRLVELVKIGLESEEMKTRKPTNRRTNEI
ncbi:MULTISPECIES: Mini-ribonuclease 3 [Lachnospira]|jgi:ribonuclease-3 family protein|uniref:Mini-ribonuclease 3 n=2 Tax=Lachnospira TaxID=28050 RepID=A0A1H5W9Q8_9FIRM|nr:MULTISPECIES: ribonuclease III domain-containing protein [Lachnospira]MBQ2472675.1 ribonuclease III [Lachnospira sp.]SDN21567.1 ribonuclease-3 family protein [Lachnospira pectinoschiza]SEF95931.1 ribonuclease-3 family protein [Lachnospira multipara]